MRRSLVCPGVSLLAFSGCSPDYGFTVHIAGTYKLQHSRCCSVFQILHTEALQLQLPVGAGWAPLALESSRVSPVCRVCCGACVLRSTVPPTRSGGVSRIVEPPARTEPTVGSPFQIWTFTLARRHRRPPPRAARRAGWAPSWASPASPARRVGAWPRVTIPRRPS